MEYPTEPNEGSKRIGKAEMDALVNRLYDQQMERAAKREAERQQQLAKSCFKQRSISKEGEGDLVKRIYDNQVQRFKANKEERERAMDEETHRYDKKMSDGDIQDQVERIYTQEVAKSKSRREEILKKYLPEQEPKKISKAKLKESVERLYHVDYAKRDEELFKKHVYPFDPPSRKITPSDLDAMANRLSTRGGA